MARTRRLVFVVIFVTLASCLYMLFMSTALRTRTAIGRTVITLITLLSRSHDVFL